MGRKRGEGMREGATVAVLREEGAARGFVLVWAAGLVEGATRGCVLVR